MTWGLKSRAGDRVMLFNLTQREAESIATRNPEFIAVPILKEKCRPRSTDPNDRPLKKISDLSKQFDFGDNQEGSGK